MRVSDADTVAAADLKGRTAIAEVLVLDDHLRDLIATKASVLEMKEAARAEGTSTHT